MKYIGLSNYPHGSAERIGILVANLGTPNAPTAPALRRYLRQFFDDPRVFEFPRLTWWLLTRAIILNRRPRRSAALYASIWRQEGSPLLLYSQAIADGLQARLQPHSAQPLQVALGMRYGDPSIPYALNQLRAANVRRLLILPLFPQYSATTVASVFDAVTAELQRWRWLPELRFIMHYHDQAAYIAALVERIRQAWQANGRGEKLVFSFHGIPKRYFMNGDPYYCECQKTARLVAEALDLPKADYVVAFQSRFGREEWLKPYTSEALVELAAQGVRRVDVICPGFAADCLETLEEIDSENRKVFLEAGGEAYQYIPALNDSPMHLEALSALALQHLQGWLQPQLTSA
ncbi:MAG: ferrochelatase [Candidatus Thermofonsia Clade 1 bacterium]|jgi:ferrochelatase|uniref:Ferrochelatase n=1 Tax=Candidatus Thermofonsia Clade 1 bacterium TaxID=2364210 RepID=A0A2M8PIM5_9CHLR|nr:MAG: ferrochelatase [Candidatus Thermofonsia Clade 1 bacterium]RMF49262.1 MAG: ferrochelatase [Chloroflexota bacterium]